MSLDKSAPHSLPAASAPSSSSSSVAPAGDFAPISAWRRPGMGLTSAPEERLLHHHSHGHGHHPRPHTPGLAEAEDEASSARRGVKRPRDQLSNCDCDNVYIPLSKKIHGLNIERQQEGDAAAAAAAAAGNGSGGGGNAPEQQQQFVSFQVRKKDHYCERASNIISTTRPTPTSFQENYPYEASSPYYVSNHLLYHLHMEKMQRVEQQQRQQQQHRP